MEQKRTYELNLISNYHTHTKRCHHACGEDREYVEEAIDAGFKILGFSDHTCYPTGFKSGMRMDLSDVDGYFSSIEELKKEYKNDIEIYAGLETEYFPKYFNKLLDFLQDYPLDYMILGQHFVPDEEHGVGTAGPFTDKSILDMYVENVVAGMRTGKFMYVAHPDLPVYVGDDKDVVLFEAYNQICSVAKELNIPLEINVLGHMRGKYYPSDNFFKVAAEHKNDVIIGMDIHNPKHFHNKDDVEFCVRLAEKYNLNLLSEIKML